MSHTCMLDVAKISVNTIRSLRHLSTAAVFNSKTNLKMDNVEFRNVMPALKSKGDLAYALQSRNFPVYKLCKQRSVEEMKKQTLNGDRVVELIKKTVDSKQYSKNRADDLAQRIIDTMAHNFNMTSVRSLAYPTKKVIQHLYTGIYVNENIMDDLKRLCVESPIIFMPTHRTYMDFILLHFLCFHYEIPLPAIASGQDFLQMRLVSQRLRNCGAYFIRRSFNNDPVYKAIFNEYVQNQLINGDRPLEAFVEGTRSRTGKSLQPKYGFLTAALEPLLTNRLFDVHIVPVSISYDRIVEETLYAYEMLGFSKPRETTSGLLKAWSILSSNYGRVFVHFGQPLSVRDFFDANKSCTTFSRAANVMPSSARFSHTAADQQLVRRVAHAVVSAQQRGLIVDLWPLACLEMGRLIAYDANFKNVSMPSVDYDLVVKGVAKLYDLAHRLGHRIQMVEQNFSDALNQKFELHSNLVQFDRSKYQLILQQCHSDKVDTSKPSAHILKHALHLAVNRIMLAHYANQCLHLFAPLFYLAAAFNGRRTEKGCQVRIAQLRNHFEFLQKLLSREFVCDSLNEDCFEAALQKGLQANVFSLGQDNLMVTNWQDVKSLKFMLEPFLINYFMCLDFLTFANRQIILNDFLNTVQCGALTRLNPIMFGQDHEKSVSNNYTQRAPSWYQILSVDTAKNCFHSLVDLGALKKANQDTADSSYEICNAALLARLKSQLGSIMDNFYDVYEIEIGADSSHQSAKLQQIRAKL